MCKRADHLGFVLPHRIRNALGRTYMDKNKNLEMMAWLAGGVALCGAVAVFLAPDTGSRTRQKLVEQAEEGGRSLLGSGQDWIAKGRDLFEQGRGIVED